MDFNIAKAAGNETPHLIHEDNHVIVVAKLPGIPTQSDRSGDPCLIDIVKDFIAKRDAKPGNVYLSAVHRIDRPSSGLVLMARTSKGASRLSEQMREGLIHKEYLAVVEGRPDVEKGRLEGWIAKNAARNTSRMVDKGFKGAKYVACEYELLTSVKELSLLSVRLETGRSHQVRVQMAHAGYPVAGDRRYGAKSGFGNMIALHSCRLRFSHPTRKESIDVALPPPDIWAKAMTRQIFEDAKNYLINSQ